MLMILCLVFVSFSQAEEWKSNSDIAERELRLSKVFSISACVTAGILFVLHVKQEKKMESLKRTILKAEAKADRLEVDNLRVRSVLTDFSLRVLESESKKKAIVK